MEEKDLIETINPEVIEVEKLIAENGDGNDTTLVPNFDVEIADIIKGNSSPKVLREKLEEHHENNIADAMKLLKKSERQKLYRVLDVEKLGKIFEYVSEENIIEYLDEMDIKKAALVISELEPDTAVDVLKKLEKKKRTLVIDSMESDVRKNIKIVASFDDDEIGSKMTTNYIVVKDSIKIKSAMTELVKQAKENDNINTIFVEDKHHQFIGAIDLKELIVAKKDVKLEDLIITSFPYVYGHENIDDCIERLKDYNEALIPVLDNNNRILGVITSQNLLEVVDEEMGEDYAKLAGLMVEEELSEPINLSVKKRLPWLIILLALALFISSVVGIFEKLVSQLTIIMAFQTMILDMSGNAGTQSLAITIRILTDDTLPLDKKAQLVWKEIRVGFCNGLILGIISFIFVGAYIYFFKNRPIDFAFMVSGCIGVSMVIAMAISSFLGTFVPMLFKRIKIDPAVASGPLITTINDLIGVVTYYGMSWVLLVNIFHLA